MGTASTASEQAGAASTASEQATAASERVAGFEGVTLERLRRRTSMKWRRYPPDVLPAWVAELDVPLAEPVRRVLHEAVELGDTGYAHAGELPEVFAEFAAARLGLRVDPAHVAVVPDVMAGVAEILRVATAAGDGVVINPPVYPPFFHVVAEVGRRVVPVPLARSSQGWELDLAAIERAFAAGARAYLLCSPHNPTGRVWSRSELAQLAELAASYGVLVLADEIHAPLVLPGAEHVPFLGLGEQAAGCSVLLTSASKAWNLAGLKCAVAVTAAPEMGALITRLPAELSERSGLLGVRAGVAAFAEGGDWLDALRHHLDRNRRLLAELLTARLPEIGYQLPEASYLAWLDCAGLGLGADPAQVFLDRGRVALSPGLEFGPQGAGFARLNLGTSSTLLTEIVQRMAVAVGR